MPARDAQLFHHAGISSSACAVVAFLAVGLGGWACNRRDFRRADRAGLVVVDSNVKKVQHPTGGVVGEVRARDGDRVKAGDILVRLDETVTRANLAIVTKGLIELYARKARLGAERDGADSGRGAQGARRQGRRSRTCRRPWQASASCSNCGGPRGSAKRNNCGSAIKQLQEEIRGLTRSRTPRPRRCELIEQELAGHPRIVDEEPVPIDRLTALEREAARLQGERGQLIASAAQAKGKIAETELQILQVDQESTSDVAKELRETDGKIGEYVERKVAAEDQLKRTDIRAPQDGVVFQSTANTVGGVITAGDPIMLIVPEADTLLVEAKVDPKDIDQVAVRPGRSCFASPPSTCAPRRRSTAP